jgi:hypothetical protein
LGKQLEKQIGGGKMGSTKGEDMMKDFKPYIIEEHINNAGIKDLAYDVMLVELHPCPICDKYMLQVDVFRESIFPKYFRINMDTQLKNAGWVKESEVIVDDKSICQDCAERYVKNVISHMT